MAGKMMYTVWQGGKKMETEIGRPFTGYRLTELKRFLRRMDLDYDDGVEYTVTLTEGDEIAAAGSLDGNVLKCIAVDPRWQGEGLTATVVSELRREAFRRGREHLFLFTKPKNRRMFEGLSFFPIAETGDMLLLESVRNGIRDFVSSLKKAPVSGRIGCVVMNCNPFTLGHRYLVETAAGRCDWLHVFVLSAERSLFSAGTRRLLAERGTADLPNVTVHPTGDYLISAATFPDYFLNDKTRADEIRCQLDLEIFCRYFVPALGITCRFVGTEPLSPVTAAYNEAMKAYLPPRGVEVTELTRKEIGGEPVSASRVRALLAAGDLAPLEKLVPKTTLDYLKEHPNEGG